MIKISDLSMQCGTKLLFSDVNLLLLANKRYGVVGANGSGKSTLLQMICGTLTPTTGSIQTDGRVAALLELGSGFNPEFTGRENVYLNATVLGLTKAEIDERFDDFGARRGVHLQRRNDLCRASSRLP